MPEQAITVFPRIDQISDYFACRTTLATINNEHGKFYGSVNKHSGLPQGEGVFIADNGWIHCGAV